MQAALDAGATGLVSKSVTVDHVVGAITRAHAGERLDNADELEALLETLPERGKIVDDALDRVQTLTPREVEVLTILSTGERSKTVAQRLGISIGTVKTHIRSILHKTGAANQLQAINVARAAGLIQDPEPPARLSSEH